MKGKDSSGLSDRRLARQFPLRIEDRIEERVAPVVLVPLVLAEPALADHADLLENARRGGVRGIALGPDPVQAALAESEFDHRGGGFARDAPIPERGID